MVRNSAERAVRWAYLSIGVVCVGFGTAGVFLPGLPTTIFLILASYFLTRSCPWLEERLVRNRFFGPYLRWLDGDVPMPRKAKITAICMMWAMIALSVGVIVLKGLAWWIVGAVVASGVIGTVFIARYRGLRRPSA